MQDPVKCMSPLKLYMVLLGCKPKGRHVEQHDVFFGIATSLQDLAVQIKAFWPGSGKLHIDAWREVTIVDGFRIDIEAKLRPDDQGELSGEKLFFINLGGYLPDRFEEQHYMLLTIKADRASAILEAKRTQFFRTNHFKGATSHIDDKYGIDVDDIYQIQDILSADQKQQYRIVISPSQNEQQDQIHLGYLKMSVLKQQ
jgi:hypothetical protein